MSHPSKQVRDDSSHPAPCSHDELGRVEQNVQPDALGQRRLIERLSGWRLQAFLASAAINLGMIVAFGVLPLLLDSARLFFCVALVSASHAVFVFAVAGFRFSIAAKLVAGFAHATACVWALVGLGAAPWVLLGGQPVLTLYLIPLLTLQLTGGGIVIAWRSGFHHSKRFGMSDLFLVVTAIAIILPILLNLIPTEYFFEGMDGKSWRTTCLFSLVGAVSGFVVLNFYLRLGSREEAGLTTRVIFLGWFLLLAMISWNLCQFGLIVSGWTGISMIPFWKISAPPTQADTSKSAESVSV